ncbi:hypothetical protein [Arthrobacter sp. MW3 TE3886]
MHLVAVLSLGWIQCSGYGPDLSIDALGDYSRTKHAMTNRGR